MVSQVRICDVVATPIQLWRDALNGAGSLMLDGPDAPPEKSKSKRPPRIALALPDEYRGRLEVAAAKRGVAPAELVKVWVYDLLENKEPMAPVEESGAVSTTAPKNRPKP